jgi:hypothetical protein
VALFLLVRDATGRDGLATAFALGFALVPPFLFYFFQFYPEMLGALVLALAFRTLALRPEGLARHPWLLGWMMAALPWLHQKFLPVWLALVATALWAGSSSRAVVPSPMEAAGRRLWAAGLLVPTAVSLCSTALYNFAITGSVRPDSLFLAWGPGGVSGARVGQGLLGLLLDARYGILPYVPILVLAAGGLAVGGARRLAVVLPAAATYYLTVASADNWAGAVCNLGRYFMPVAPLAVALVGVAIHEAARRPEGPPGEGAAPGGAARRGVVALVLMLAGWTGLFAVALWRDPHAANDAALLLAKGTYADGNQYVPNLFIRRWSDAAPGLWARVSLWALAVAAVALWLRRVAAAPARRPRGASPLATLAAVAGLVLAAALVLERWPGKREAPSFAGRLAIAGVTKAPGAPVSSPPPLVFPTGAARVRGDEAILGPGTVELLLRAPVRASSLRVTVGGPGGVLRVPGRPPIVLRPSGALLDLPLVLHHEARGRDGRRVAFSRVALGLDGEAVLRLGEGPPAAPGDVAPPAAPEGEMEPEAGGAR